MQIRRLKIKRFRGIQNLTWTPSAGFNCLTGPGDAGKSTILEAISTVLSAAPGRVASEYDYFDGNVADGFVIEALLGRLEDSLLRAWPVAPLWTWMAETEQAQADPDPAGEGVLCVRARGTEDLEIEHVLVDPSDGEVPLSPSKRNLFGLSTLGPATTAFRELRMSRGSLLARTLDRQHLRGLVTEAVQTSRESFTPPGEVQSRLDLLSSARSALVPGAGDLTLAMLSPRGQNLLGMIGLFARRTATDVPLLNAGLGTQQLTLFTLATSLIESTPLFVVDEVESGLEPFRQRELIARVRDTIGADGQAFVTTHSPAAVGEMSVVELQRVDGGQNGNHSVRPFPASLESIKNADPEALLCRLPVLVEGQTELGLVETAFAPLVASIGTTLGALGIRLVDGGGQPRVFGPLRALRDMGLRCGSFLDTEEAHGGKRQELADDPGVAFGTYSAGKGLEDALAVTLPIEALEGVVRLPGPGRRDVSDGRYQQVNELAGNQARTLLSDLAGDLGEERCRDLFATAAKKGAWFKTREGGATIAHYLLENHPSCQILRDVGQFWDRVMGLVADQLPTTWPPNDVVDT